MKYEFIAAHEQDYSINLLKQAFEAKRPNEKWCQDIWATEGWLYLPANGVIPTEISIGCDYAFRSW